MQKDNMEVEAVAYAKGEHNTTYFENNGTFIRNNSIIEIAENGKYTIYASDSVGNEVVRVIEVNNISDKKPVIDIDVKTKIYTSEIEVEITSDDATELYYSIGNENNYKTVPK